MGKAAEALKLVEEHLDAIDAAGWADRRLPAHDELRVKRLFYYRPFLMVEAALDVEDETMARLIPRVERVDPHLKELTGNLGMGYVAVVSAGDTLEDVLEDVPRVIAGSKRLLVGPAAYYGQIGMKSLGAEQV